MVSSHITITITTKNIDEGMIDHNSVGRDGLLPCDVIRFSYFARPLCHPSLLRWCRAPFAPMGASIGVRLSPIVIIITITIIIAT